MTIITREAINAMIDQRDLMYCVGHLAAQWRYAGMHALADEQAAIQAVYALAIERLFAIGYDEVGGLDVESELPDAFMPHEYLHGILDGRVFGGSRRVDGGKRYCFCERMVVGTACHCSVGMGDAR